MVNKKAQINWYLIISLILGLIILAIAISWIFQEYFTSEDMNWETCRQAIVLRSMIPGDYISEMKEGASLKCKTTPFIIDTKNKQEAVGEIANISASCFYMTGEGKVEIFERDSTTPKTYCLVCARISIKDDLRQQYSADKIPVWSYLKDNRFDNKQTYLEYFYSNFVNHPFVQRQCSGIKADDSFIKDNSGIPDYWEDTSKDMFVVMAYLNKGKVVTDSLPMGFGKLPCSKESWQLIGSQIYQSEPPMYSLMITQDINKITEDCTEIVSIPA